MRKEERRGGQALMCDCCTYPYAYIQAGKLVVTSRHGSQQHTNTLTPEELRQLADDIEAAASLSSSGDDLNAQRAQKLRLA